MGKNGTIRMVALVACVLLCGGVAIARPLERRDVTRTCSMSQLRVSWEPAVGGGGHFGLRILFYDTGGPCSLRGYPRVAGPSRSGRQVVQFTRRLKGYLGGTSAVRTVQLRHGGTASSLLEGLAGPVRSLGRCASFVSLLVTPPGDRRAVRLSHNTLCYPEVHPVVAGRRGGNDG